MVLISRDTLRGSWGPPELCGAHFESRWPSVIIPGHQEVGRHMNYDGWKDLHKLLYIMSHHHHCPIIWGLLPILGQTSPSPGPAPPLISALLKGANENLLASSKPCPESTSSWSLAEHKPSTRVPSPSSESPVLSVPHFQSHLIPSTLPRT